MAPFLERSSVWLLGSSDYSAQLAAHLGWPFAFAAHLADENVEMALAVYRQTFRPSAVLDRPNAIVSFGVLAADDERDARRQAWACAHSMMRMSQRKSFVVPTPEEAEAYPYAATDRHIIEGWNARIMSGAGEAVVERWQQRLGADELMVLNLGLSPDAMPGCLMQAATSLRLAARFSCATIFPRAFGAILPMTRRPCR